MVVLDRRVPRARLFTPTLTLSVLVSTISVVSKVFFFSPFFFLASYIAPHLPSRSAKLPA